MCNGWLCSLTFSGLAKEEVTSDAAWERGSRRAADKGSLDTGILRGSLFPELRGSDTIEAELEEESSFLLLDLLCLTLEEVTV